MQDVGDPGRELLLDRRAFLQRSALLAVAAAAPRLPGFGCAGPPLPAELARHASAPAIAVPPFELDEVTLDQLQKHMQGGRYTAKSLLDLYLGRIEAIDSAGPQLRSIIELNPDAARIAEALDAERRAGKVRGPLHGIPLILKDNVDTGDRMRTSCGSLALADAPAPKDAFIAQRLRDAGVVIVGKSNLSEWAKFRSMHATSGWSARGGLTRNPYALDRSACGSSSGTGVAVAANLTAIGIGTETDGSIVCPSSANGLVGMKPTVGFCSRSGIIPVATSMDSAGPMCRTVRDAAILLGALAGVDPADPATAASDGNVFTDYTSFLDPRGLKGARIGVLRQFMDSESRADVVMDDALRAMKSAGAVIVDPVVADSFSELDNPEFEMFIFEFKAGINAYLATRGPRFKYKTLGDLIQFNRDHRDQELRYFGQEFFELAQLAGPITSPEYLDAVKQCRVFSQTQGIDRLLSEQKLDALVMLTSGPAWVSDLINGDHLTEGSSTPAAVAGYPSISVPAGFVFGLPVGISFVGDAWSEARLIKLAYAFEQATKVRRPPSFAPSVVLDK